jgi:S1-C subfamily serine protease
MDRSHLYLAFALLLPTGPLHGAEPDAPWRAPTREFIDALPRSVVAAPRAAAGGEHGRHADARDRFAVSVAADFTPRMSGRWEIAADGGRVWRLVIRSEQAKSLSLHLSGVRLPDSGRLYVYGASGEVVHGPYTRSDLTAARELWTPVVPGDEAVVEVRTDAPGEETLDLTVAQVQYGFRSFGDSPPVADNCNVDVACDVAQPWGGEVRSVARLVISGKYVCTGTLVNNTAQDGTPYLLTARHCVPDQARADSVVVYWGYANSRCSGTPDGSLDQTQTGAMLVAENPDTDVALLRLREPPKREFGVHYAGWDRRDLVPSSAVAIHHPFGREKQISFDDDPLRITPAFATDEAENGDFLMVGQWQAGSTEPGSSGAGLWNGEHRLVGHYSGGYSSCSDPQHDWFGRLARAWDPPGAAADGERLRPFLDPSGTGADTLDGMDAPATAAPAASGGGGALRLQTLVMLLAAGLVAARRRVTP